MTAMTMSDGEAERDHHLVDAPSMNTASSR